jgi:hypothetical protein
MMTRRLSILLLALGLTGAANEPDPPSRAAAVAARLVRAEMLAAAPGVGARHQLATDLDALEQMGVHPLAADEHDVVATWRTRVGRAGAPFRGRVLGPAYRRGWIGAGERVRLEQLFLSGQVATASLAATPDQPVSMAVSGGDAANICASPGRNCRWMPVFTQRYTITISNAGTRPTLFYLVLD